MDVTQTYRFIVRSEDLPDDTDYVTNALMAKQVATILLAKYNNCFGTSETLRSQLSDGYYYYFFPVFKFDGTPSTLFYIGAKGNTRGSEGSVKKITIGLFWARSNYRYFTRMDQLTGPCQVNLKTQSSLEDDAFMGTGKERVSQMFPMCFTFFPVPNGYFFGTYQNSTESVLNNAIPCFGYYFLEGKELDGTSIETCIQTRCYSVQALFPCIYPGVEYKISEPDIFIPSYIQGAREMQTALACKALGKRSVDVYVSHITATSYHPNPTITSFYLAGEHTDTNSPIVDIYSKDGETYATSLYPIGICGVSGVVLVFKR